MKTREVAAANAEYAKAHPHKPSGQKFDHETKSASRSALQKHADYEKDVSDRKADDEAGDQNYETHMANIRADKGRSSVKSEKTKAELQAAGKLGRA
jgi:hypothetical protein